MRQLGIRVQLTEKDIERFWDKVVVGRLDECWIFQGYCRSKKAGGHGQFRVDSVPLYAHRVALASTGVNVIGQVVRHRCNVPSCCNPSHLHTGDHWDNVDDRVASDRSAKGAKNGRARLTEAIVIEMRGNTRPHYQFAKKYGVDSTTVSLARRGVTWSHLNEEYPPITKTTGF